MGRGLIFRIWGLSFRRGVEFQDRLVGTVKQIRVKLECEDKVIMVAIRIVIFNQLRPSPQCFCAGVVRFVLHNLHVQFRSEEHGRQSLQKQVQDMGHQLPDLDSNLKISAPT